MSIETIEAFERALLEVTDSAIKAAAKECGGGCNAGDLLMVAAARAFCIEHGGATIGADFLQSWADYAKEVMTDEEFGGVTYRIEGGP